MKFNSYIIILVCVFINVTSSGQVPDSIVKNLDVINRITVSKFDSLIKRETSLLESHDLNQISDSDHVVIIKIINTLDNSFNEDYSKRFTVPQYEEFTNLLLHKKYYNEILRIFPEYTHSRGPGIYFNKLKVELKGSPHSFSMYKVIN